MSARSELLIFDFLNSDYKDRTFFNSARIYLKKVEIASKCLVLPFTAGNPPPA